MDMDYLLFLWSISSSIFRLYVEFIRKFLPWIFAFDDVHYARWLSIHHYDMEMLKDTNLEVFQQFNFHGKFTVARTKNRFSKMCLDQLHKQLKEDINGKQCWKPITKRK